MIFIHGRLTTGFAQTGKAGEAGMNELTTDELLDDLDYCGYDPYYDDFRKDIVAEIRRRLEEQQVIVRCKDCIFGEPIEERYICINSKHCQSKSNKPDWFCADGVRRE